MIMSAAALLVTVHYSGNGQPRLKTDSAKYTFTKLRDKIDPATWNTSSIRAFGKTVKTEGDAKLVLGLATRSFVTPCKGQLSRGVSRHHAGMDIRLSKGDPVVAAFDGIVRFAKRDKGGYGKLVIIRHTNGLETYYAHLSDIKVQEDEEVRAGEVIGLGGNTGHSHGSHLHFEMRYHDVPIDPAKIVDYYGTEVIADTVNFKEVSSFPKRKHERGKHHISTGKSSKSIKGGYTLQRGDNLETLAKRHKTTVKELCRINNINPKTVIRAGDKLKIK
jgi:hypothetical protein